AARRGCPPHSPTQRADGGWALVTGALAYSAAAYPVTSTPSLPDALPPDATDTSSASFNLAPEVAITDVSVDDAGVATISGTSANTQLVTRPISSTDYTPDLVADGSWTVVTGALAESAAAYPITATATDAE